MEVIFLFLLHTKDRSSFTELFKCDNLKKKNPQLRLVGHALFINKSSSNNNLNWRIQKENPTT